MPMIIIQPMATRCECGRIIKTDSVRIVQSERAACVQHTAYCWKCNMTFVLRNIKKLNDDPLSEF